jgi:hypothetical protein
MARSFDGPLSADDLAYLRQRYSEAYVENLINIHGTKRGADSETSQAKADAAAQEAAEQAAREAEEAALAAQREADEAAAEAARQAEAAAAEEDLIGDTGDFNVLESTEPEVKSWAANASDEDKAAALSAEQARTDRDPRKGVVSLLS